MNTKTKLNIIQYIVDLILFSIMVFSICLLMGKTLALEKQADEQLKMHDIILNRQNEVLMAVADKVNVKYTVITNDFGYKAGIKLNNAK